MKESTPVVVLTEYTPLPGTTKVVPVHPGDTWAPVHSLTDVAVRVVPWPAVSLNSGLMLCVAPCRPDVVSGEAELDGAGVTVGVMVDVAT
jgi:hypothetical protein